MKLRNQSFIVIALTCLAFIAITVYPPIRTYLPYLASATILSSLVTLFLLRKLIIKRVEKLDHKIKAISLDNETAYRLPVEHHDELASIAMNVNELLNNIQRTQAELDLRVDERTQDLQTENKKLQQAIKNQQRPSQQNNNDDRECLSKIARYDTLTSLPNRVFFNEILNKAISHAKRHNKLLAVLLIDIDNFSKLTKTLGQEKCDYVIKEIGRRFINTLRTEDIIAKLEGDEFIILLNDINKSKFASSVAQKLLQICSHPMKIDEHEFALTASIGICVYPSDGGALEVLLNHLDQAVFKAKSTGGDKYQYHTHEMDVEAREYIELESALRKALHNNELALHYQPKLSVRKGTICGVEALMRWEHPVLGVITPAKFIPLAEETGIIMQIGEWALREACRTVKFWQDEGYEHLTVSLNLSAKQFHHPEIAKVIANSLKITGLSPTYLELEITETTVMNNIELAASILDTIQATGVQISIDHFGTGYTSISALKHFPIRVLKIDQTFIKSIPNIPNDMAITSALISLAHNLGLEVVAEGVETAEQVQYLSSQGCDMIQGYFLSHPLPAQKIILQFKKLQDEVMT